MFKNLSCSIVLRTNGTNFRMNGIFRNSVLGGFRGNIDPENSPKRVKMRYSYKEKFIIRSIYYWISIDN
jgi:hypothetical protein